MDDKGYIDEATVIKATQTSERQPYDVVRGALKQVELDSSRRVELDDYVDVSLTFLQPMRQPAISTRQLVIRAQANPQIMYSSSPKSEEPPPQHHNPHPLAAYEVSAMQPRANSPHLLQAIERKEA